LKPPRFDYVRADDIAEVLALIAEHGNDARIVAGG
jgi:CO/xanthine dehydrogenase FAD-binding subunit